MREIEEKELDEFLHRKGVKSEHTRISYKNCIGQLLECYNIQTLEDYSNLTKSQIEKHLNSLPIKESSYNQHLRSIKAFTTWLFEDNRIKEDFSKAIKITKVRDSTGDKEYDKKRRAKEKLYLTDEEIQKMIAVSKGINAKLAMALMGYMGVRREELVNLQVSDIRNLYIGISGKGGTYEERKMPQVVKFLIEEYLKNRNNDSEYLIVSKVGQHQIKNTHSIYERIKSAGRRAGIDPEKMKLVTPHTMRRSTACNAVLRGVPPSVVKEVLRHRHQSTTDIYLEALKGSEAVDQAFDSMPMPDISILM
jgi:integrase